MPNETSPEPSRRDFSNADHFGTDTIPTVDISTMPWNIGPGGCDGVMYAVVPVHGSTPSCLLKYKLCGLLPYSKINIRRVHQP